MSSSSPPRTDAYKKVTGSEQYAIDHYPDGMLWAGVKRAGIPHGTIRQIITESAASLYGVVKILTAKDVPHPNRQGIVHKDMPVIADDRVRYVGDPIALVIAEDITSLKQALSLIEAEIDPLDGVFTVEDALNQDSPIIHPEHQGGNILASAVIEKGDIEKAFSECAVVVEQEFSTQIQAHAFLETENGIAWQDESGLITMIVSTQAPFRDRFEIAQSMGLDFKQIRVIAPHLGGGFGGKDGATVQCPLALAAMHTGGRPVKMVWDRKESMIAGYKRHQVKMRYKLGALVDGTLHALFCELYYDTGAYAHLGAEVMALGMEHAGGPYRIGSVRIEGKCVYTNNPVAGAMRAFGVCQVTFAFEQMIDMLAVRLGLDKLEIRLKNALKRGDENCSGIRMSHSTEIVQCLEIIKGHPIWKDSEDWKAGTPIFKRRGVGLACVFNAMGYGKNVRDSAIAKIEFDDSGRFVIYNGVSDMGQGNSSTFVQIASDVLSQEMEMFSIIQPDTAICYPSGSSSAGRTTYVYGNALIRACEDLKARLINRAGLVMFVDDDSELELINGAVLHIASGRKLPLYKLAQSLNGEDRVCIQHFITEVACNTNNTGRGIQLGFPHRYYSFGAHLAMIEVDELTGAIEVKGYIAVTDGGKVINRQVFDQQIEGAVAQGIGYALMEDFILKDGNMLTTDLSTYLIPVTKDIPNIESIPADSIEETGPMGMKGVGEVAMNGPLPAIANALHDACGMRIFHAPLTAEKTLLSITQGEQLDN